MSDILSALEARVRELEDVREVNDLFFKWHYDCTGGFGGKQAGREEALECLTEDGTIEVNSLHEPGKGPKGRAQYTEFWDYFYGDAGPLPYVFQNSVCELVKVDGDKATQTSIQFGMFQNRGGKPRMGLSQRVNYYRREPVGWRIEKTTIEGGFSVYFEQLHGALNQLPPAEARQPWTYKG
jgi:hypothetical protein